MLSPPKGPSGRFVDYLESLVGREDRAALAALRRGLGKDPGTAVEMYPYVEPFLPLGSRREEQDAFYLVAALFAVHQGNWAKSERERVTNLGASFHRLATTTESGSIERRFVALLNCRREDLPPHLRHAVSLLKAHEVLVDWRQLLTDVMNWERPSRSVQRAWAGAFWGAVDGEEDPTPGVPAIVPDESSGEPE